MNIEELDNQINEQLDNAEAEKLYWERYYTIKLERAKDNYSAKKEVFFNNPFIYLTGIVFKCMMLLPIAIMIWALCITVFGQHPAAYMLQP